MKKIIATMLALTTAAALTACHKTDDTEKTTTADTTVAQVITEPTTGSITEATEPSITEATEPSAEATEPVTEAPEEFPDTMPPIPGIEDFPDGYYSSNYEESLSKNGFPQYHVLYEEGVEVSRQEYSYTADSVTMRFYYKQTLESSTTWDINGNPIEFIYYVEKIPVMRYSFTYNNDGEAINYLSEVLNKEGNSTTIASYEGGAAYANLYGYEFFGDGTEQWCRYNTYDENNALLTEKEVPLLTEYGDRRFYTYNSDDQLMEIFSTVDGLQYKAEYDEFGRLSYEISYSSSESDSTDYYYDEEGNCTSHSIGATYGYSDQIYDDMGNIIHSDFYGDGDLESTSDYIYNENGDVIEWKWGQYGYDENLDVIFIGEEIYTYQYNYRDDGQWDEQVCYRGDEEYDRVTREFNEAGQVITEQKDGSTYTYTYDDRGRVAEELISN